VALQDVALNVNYCLHVSQMEEVPSTIPSLWPITQRWLEANPQHVAAGNLLPALLEDEAPRTSISSRHSTGSSSKAGSTTVERSLLVTPERAAGRKAGVLTLPQQQAQQPQQQSSPYAGKRFTGCHFWSNFEVGRLDFFRSPAYRSFFAHLDADTGFFYER
jgi:hypothetical protein